MLVWQRRNYGALSWTKNLVQLGFRQWSINKEARLKKWNFEPLFVTFKSNCRYCHCDVNQGIPQELQSSSESNKVHGSQSRNEEEEDFRIKDQTLIKVNNSLLTTASGQAEHLGYIRMVCERTAKQRKKVDSQPYRIHTIKMTINFLMISHIQR